MIMGWSDDVYGRNSRRVSQGTVQEHELFELSHDSKRKMRPRRFSASQRVALFLRSQGRCMLCQIPLAPGWHADHREAYSGGGTTDVTNGQATCAICNLQKGNRVPK